MEHEIPDSRHAFMPSRTKNVCDVCSWHRDDPSQHPQPAREIPADELAEARRFAETSPHRTAVEARLAAEVRRQAVELERVHSALAHESDAHVAERTRLRARVAELERLRGELERAQAEAIRLRPIERRARDIHRDGTDHGRAVARVILGEAP